MTVYIYALWQRGEENPRYIGGTKNPKARWSGHKSNKKHELIYAWLNSDAPVVMVILEKVECRARIDGFGRENIYIVQYAPIYNKAHTFLSVENFRVFVTDPLAKSAA